MTAPGSMKLLAIETSTEACSVAIAYEGAVLERYEHAPRRHAELLLPWVQSLLAEAGASLAELDAIAFSRGPGSFTSLRIGIGVVQGLAWASARPVVPVSSLAATAQAAESGVTTALVALDARMGEVFSAAFRRDDNGIMRPLGEEAVCAPGQVRVPDAGPVHALGIGFERYAELRELASGMTGAMPRTWPRAASVLALAQNWLQGHRGLPAESAQPVYLRDNVAAPPPAQ